MKNKAVSVPLLLVLLLLITVAAAEANTRGIAIRTEQGEKIGRYTGSYALLVGVSRYTSRSWPDLTSVPAELRKVKAALEKHGFRIQTVLNPDSRELKDAFDQFIYEHGYDPNNRLLFFYSGHGFSRRDGTKGYLVPADAPDPREGLRDFLRKSLDMTQIVAWSRQMTAKHALFLFDSCFSGTIFQTKSLPERPPHIDALTSKPVRQFISAGTAGQEVPAESVFAPSFIKGLRGQADFTGDGYITGTELGMYLRDKVVYYNSGQTPQYGKIRDPSLDEGDFVFLAGGTAGTQTTSQQAHQKGSLEVRASPAEARVLVNGRFQGYAPVALSEVEPGSYRIQAEKEGYTTSTKQVQVRPGRTTAVSLSLDQERGTGRIWVHPTPEDARVRIMNIEPKYHDGIELGPGEYEILVTKNGYAPVERRERLRAGQDVHIGIVLDKKSGSASDESHQAGDTWTEPITGMVFVWVPGGCYMMGSPLTGKPGQASLKDKPLWYQTVAALSCLLPVGCAAKSFYDSHGYDSDESPVHKVCLDGFWMAKHEVTIEQYRRYLQATDHTAGVDWDSESCPLRTGDSYPLSKNSFGREGRQPMVEVSWHGAAGFAEWLSQQTGHAFRLPTEAEWEYAARNRGGRVPYAGGEHPALGAWYLANSGGRTHAVGSKAPNGLGLFDMSGNVWEWCADSYDFNAYSRHSPKNPLVETSDADRVVRGGCWAKKAKYLRTTSRLGFDQYNTKDLVGFRLVRSKE